MKLMRNTALDFSPISSLPPFLQLSLSQQIIEIATPAAGHYQHPRDRSYIVIAHDRLMYIQAVEELLIVLQSATR